MSSEAAKKAWETRRANQDLVVGSPQEPKTKIIKTVTRTKTRELYDALNLCKKFTSPKEFVTPSFKCFQFHGRKVRAFDKDVGIEMTVPKGYDFPPCSVSADFFLGTLKQYLDDEVTFKIEGNVMWLQKDGEVAANIALPYGRAEHDLTSFPEVPDDRLFKPFPEGFQEAVDLIWFATMREPIAFNKLSAIFVDGKSMYATNNIVLSRALINCEFGDRLVIPDQIFTTLGKYRHAAQSYYAGKERFWVRGSNFKAFTDNIRRPLDVDLLRAAIDDFPKNAPVCRYEPTEVLNSLQRIQFYVNGESKRMTFELNGKMIFSGQNEKGNARSEAPCRYSGKPVPPIQFGYDYLVDCVKRAKAFSVTTFRERMRFYFKEANLEMLLISFKERE